MTPGKDPTPGGGSTEPEIGPRKRPNRDPAKRAAQRRKDRARATVKAVARTHRMARSAVEDERPIPPAALAAGLQRGTETFRRWEAAQILALRAAGLTPPQIREQLGMTEEEYLARREAIRTQAEPGDAILAWEHYLASCSRHTQDAERILSAALEAPDRGNVALGAVRLLHDISTDVLKLGLEAGVFARMNQGTGLQTIADLVRRVGLRIEATVTSTDLARRASIPVESVPIGSEDAGR